jgi:hypothetical protein
MPDRHDPTPDHRKAPRSEPDHAGRATAILDDLEQRLGRPVPPAIRELIIDMAGAGPFASLADAMQAATRAAQAKRISVWEYAAREFDPTPGDDTSDEE